MGTFGPYSHRINFIIMCLTNLFISNRMDFLPIGIPRPANIIVLIAHRAPSVVTSTIFPKSYRAHQRGAASTRSTTNTTVTSKLCTSNDCLVFHLCSTICNLREIIIKQTSVISKNNSFFDTTHRKPSSPTMATHYF